MGYELLLSDWSSACALPICSWGRLRYSRRRSVRLICFRSLRIFSSARWRSPRPGRISWLIFGWPSMSPPPTSPIPISSTSSFIGFLHFAFLSILSPLFYFRTLFFFVILFSFLFFFFFPFFIYHI